MARKCCGLSCACQLSAGNAHISVSGTGTSTDPFVITGDVALQVVDTSTFNLTLTGSGTIASPWMLTVAYASTAKLDDIPDVQAPSPTNGQAILWDSSISTYTSQSVPTAAPGFVCTDSSLQGDGSVGAPLGITFDPAGYLDDGGSGAKISD